MIESAYFTMMGDKLVKKVESKAKSKAARKLRSTLSDNGVRGRNQDINTSGDSLDNLKSFVSALS